VGALEFAARFLLLLLFWFLIVVTFASRLNKQDSFFLSSRDGKREVDVILNIDDDSMRELCAPGYIRMVCI